MKTKNTPHTKIPTAELRALTSPQQGTFPIQIVTGAYSGGFKLDGIEQFDVRSKTFDLSPGTHKIDPSSVARSFFTFTVHDGKVTGVSNCIAAQFAGNVLTLNTVVVTVDPGRLVSGGGNACHLPAYRTWLKAAQRFAFVPGLSYQLASGEYGPKSAMIFDVRADGTVWGWSHSANGGAGRLTLNVGWLEVAPKQPATYSIGERGPFTSTQRIPVFLGLVIVLQCGPMKGRIIPEFGEAEPRRLKVDGKLFEWKVLWNQSPAVETPARSARKKTRTKTSPSNR